MGFRKILFVVVIVAFAFIGVKAVKKRHSSKKVVSEEMVSGEARGAHHADNDEISTPVLIDSDAIMIKNEANYSPAALQSPERVDLVDKFFRVGHDKLPIVETVTYKSRVPWMKGRPAWIADYSTHYSTSCHFISRSLNRKASYQENRVSSGDQFNVLRSDVPLNFYLLVDMSKF